MKKVGDPKNPLESAVIELTLAIGQLRRRLRSEAGPLPFKLSQLATIVRLEQLDWATTAELARAESMRPQSMADVLKTLEQTGLVERRNHPTDGRQIQFALTKAGLALRRQRTRAKQGWLFDTISKLSTDEQRRLVAAIPVIKKLGGG